MTTGCHSTTLEKRKGEHESKISGKAVSLVMQTGHQKPQIVI